MKIEDFLSDEALRQKHFPVTANRIFLGHAGVTALPQTALDAFTAFGVHSTKDHQEAGGMMDQMDLVRDTMAELMECEGDEVALIGPTATGLNLVANGYDWKEGDEVVYFADDYPANVYPWIKLRELGVKTIGLEPESPEHHGVITWEVVEKALTENTKVVALASASFQSGYRIDVDEVGKGLHDRGIFFCLDSIQTLGSFRTSMKYVDSTSADSHKWLLGPMGAGIFMVKKKHFDTIKPTLLGSWNVVSPDFIAQDGIDYYPGARRYEPGSLNFVGNLGMDASAKMLNELGIDNISKRLLQLREHLESSLEGSEWTPYLNHKKLGIPQERLSGICSFVASDKVDYRKVMVAIDQANITVSHRRNRKGQKLLRISPHFYNTIAELDQLLACMKAE